MIGNLQRTHRNAWTSFLNKQPKHNNTQTPSHTQNREIACSDDLEQPYFFFLFLLIFFCLLLLLFLYISQCLFLGWLLKPNVHRMFFKFLWRRSKIQLFIYRPSMIDKQKKMKEITEVLKLKTNFGIKREPKMIGIGCLD